MSTFEKYQTEPWMGLYLYADLILIMTGYPTLKSKSILVEFFQITYFYICVCLFLHMYLPLSMWFIWRIMSWPQNNWLRLSPLIQWYVERTTKAAAASIPIHGSVLSTYVLCRLYVNTRFPNTWCIISMVAFACGSPEEYGLVLTTY